jgi:hypothetical protein
MKSLLFFPLSLFFSFSLCKKYETERRTIQTLFSYAWSQGRSRPTNAAEGEEFTQTLHLAPFFARDQSLRGRVCETFKMESIKSKFGNFPLKTRTRNQPWFHTHANSDDSEHSKKVYVHCCVCRASKIGNFSNTYEPKDTRQF